MIAESLPTPDTNTVTIGSSSIGVLNSGHIGHVASAVGERDEPNLQTQLAAPPSVDPLNVIGQAAPATEPAKKRIPRKYFLEGHIRPWEADYPAEAKATISFQRRELHQSNLALRRANQQIRALRAELRLRERVFLLKHEARLEGVSQAIDRGIVQQPAK